MNSKGITGSFNVNSFNSTIADDKAQALRWLSSLEPQKRHQHIRDTRLAGVGQWIFKTSEFQRWNTEEGGSANSVLFCHGDPGVGKTHLSSLVIDHFSGSGQDTAVAGLYCDYLNRKKQTASNMLGAILKQLVGRGNIPKDIHRAFEGVKDHFGGVRPQVPELVKMLKTAIARRRQRVVICIDGLDESLTAHRTSFLNSLQAIAQELSNVWLFLTGRPFIRGEVEKFFPGVDTLSISPTKGDTEAFLRMKLDGDTEPDAMDKRLRADIIKIIPKTISEIFLLVSLSIEAILAETTIHRRREKLKQISKGQDVGDVYTATFERIKTQENARSRLGMEAIMWVAYSERPLQPDELCQALGVEVGSKDLNKDNVPTIRTIMKCGLGFVTVDSSSSTVRLVHFTLQEHILANPTLFPSPHSAIAEVCLTYLNFLCIRDLSPALASPPPTVPFLEYASCHWGVHARREISKSAIPLALKLLDGFDRHISCKILLLKKALRYLPFCAEDDPTGFTGLHGAAFFGVLEIIIPLSETKKWDLNAADPSGGTVFSWAVRGGHDGVVKMLLEQEGLSPDRADNEGRTPFSWACQGGNEEIVKMLLERSDVNPDAVDEDGGFTPLFWAAFYGRVGVVEMLLERNDINPDAVDDCGRTTLSWTAECGCDEITWMLLRRNDVNPNSADNRGQTLLSFAASYGKEEILKVLLERNDVNPNTLDYMGWTPLSQAVFRGRKGIVEMLLEQNDVNPNMQDEWGRTPLSMAAGMGHKGIVEVLLQRSDVNPNTPDKDGRTPLSWAAASGHEGIVNMLLGRSRVSPNPTDENSRTPFQWTDGNEYAKATQLLEGLHDHTAKSALQGGLSKPLTAKQPKLPEPPLKRIRRV